MTTRLASRLNQARQQRFVGRGVELELFRAVLGQADADFVVLHIHGPGGVGKTALLREFARGVISQAHTPLWLDGRQLDASPAGFLAALQEVLALTENQSPLEALAATVGLVLFIDTYELLAPLDAWLRNTFLPQLPADALVIIAGRQAPAAAWRADNGWGELTRIISLRNLHPTESEAYLVGQGISAAEIAAILDVTYGHPLALSLAVDLLKQNSALRAQDLQRDPDIVRTLLERFVVNVPTPILRQALEICAHTFATDESLLAHCLGEEAGYAAFQWLRTLSFIEQGSLGLFPHDLAREVLEADLRWRNGTRFRALHTQVRDYIIQRIMTSDGMAQQAAIFALLFLHRNNPFMRPFYEWQAFGHLYIDRAQAADLPQIEQMIRKHQGDESLAVMRYWYARQPQRFIIFRGAGREIAGFVYVVEISQISAEDLAADSALPIVAEHVARVAGVRSGEPVFFFRNWMDAEHYQHSTAIFNMTAMFSLRLFFNTPKLAYSLITQANSDYYASMFEYLRIPLAPDIVFRMDGQEFGVFVHNWRTEPVLAWLEHMGERELLDEMVALENLPTVIPALVLSEPEFSEAVRSALKELRRPDRLAQNPLLRSRCLRERSGQEPTPALLQTTLRAGADLLTANPKTQKLYRVLWHTYFEPAPTQELAAELLDLPFSTYRYQLGKAVEQLVQWLWQQELYGVEP